MPFTNELPGTTPPTPQRNIISSLQQTTASNSFGRNIVQWFEKDREGLTKILVAALKALTITVLALSIIGIPLLIKAHRIQQKLHTPFSLDQSPHKKTKTSDPNPRLSPPKNQNLPTPTNPFPSFLSPIPHSFPKEPKNTPTSYSPSYSLSPLSFTQLSPLLSKKYSQSSVQKRTTQTGHGDITLVTEPGSTIKTPSKVILHKSDADVFPAGGTPSMSRLHNDDDVTIEAQNIISATKKRKCVLGQFRFFDKKKRKA